MNKAMKSTGLLCNLQLVLTRTALLTIYKSFTRTYLDYGGVIYDQLSNKTSEKLNIVITS